MKQLAELPLECKQEGGPDHPDGSYYVPHYKIKDYLFFIIFSSGMGWEHASVSLRKFVNRRTRKVTYVQRCPTWEEMCMIKDLFWEPEECVVQYHPPKSHYINNHQWCLHLWKPLTSALPVPESILVGIKDEIVKEPEKLNVDEGEE